MAFGKRSLAFLEDKAEAKRVRDAELASARDGKGFIVVPDSKVVTGREGGEDADSDGQIQQGGEDEPLDTNEDFWEAQGMGADVMQPAAVEVQREKTAAEAKEEEEERDTALTLSLQDEFQRSMKAWRQAARNIEWKEEKVCESVSL